jgi:hypothetical protein
MFYKASFKQILKILNYLFEFFLIRRFQQTQNHKNPITNCGEIDHEKSLFLYM